MTNTTSPSTRRETLVAGLLWVSSTGQTGVSLQDRGQSLAAQERIVRVRAERDHFVLEDVFVNYALDGDRPDKRLMSMLELVHEHQIKRLYVLSASIADDPATDVMTYTRALKEQGTDLILCDD